MKNTKIKLWGSEFSESVLYNKLALNWIFLLIFILVLIFYIVPEYKLFNQNKINFSNNYNNYLEVEKNWIWYDLLKSLNKDNDIISKMWEDFYNNSLINNTNWTYLQFLEWKKQEIEEIKKSNLIVERDKKMSKVLPFYTDWIDTEWSMTDLWFINYVERILKTFSIKTTSKIWLWNITPLDSKNKNNKDLSSEIFYSDLNLDLTGRKSDILEFLYFINNVWSIEIQNNKNIQDIAFYKDNFLNKVLAWDKKDINYNIYKNPIIDIQNINLNKYIDDSGSLIRKEALTTTQWLIAFIKELPSANEEFNVELTLRFYFRGYPNYKIENYAQSIVNKYEELSSDIKKSILQASKYHWIKTNPKILTISSILENLDSYMTDNQGKIKNLKANLNKKQDLVNIYHTANDLNYELEIILAKYKESKQELDKILNIK